MGPFTQSDATLCALSDQRYHKSAYYAQYYAHLLPQAEVSGISAKILAEECRDLWFRRRRTCPARGVAPHADVRRPVWRAVMVHAATGRRRHQCTHSADTASVEFKGARFPERWSDE